VWRNYTPAFSEIAQNIAYDTYMNSHPTAGVTRWWAGQDNAILPEPTPSPGNCLKTRRLPPVGCTLCWVRVCEVVTFQIAHNTLSV